MRHQFVGDIRDYAKYGLLRAICGFTGDKLGPQLSLGVVWYLTPDDPKSTHGSHREYLSPRHCSFRRCDPALYDALAKLERDGRSVMSIRESKLFPLSTMFYEQTVTIERRAEWFQGALDAMNGCDIVFLDPDNGLQWCAGTNTRKETRYAYDDEVLEFLERGQTVVLFHTPNRERGSTHQKQMRDVAEKLKRLQPERPILALRWRPWAPTFFFVIPSPNRVSMLRSPVVDLANSPWGTHYFSEP